MAESLCGVQISTYMSGTLVYNLGCAIKKAIMETDYASLENAAEAVIKKEETGAATASLPCACYKRLLHREC